MKPWVDRHLATILSIGFAVICTCCGFVIRQEVKCGRMEEWRDGHIDRQCQVEMYNNKFQENLEVELREIQTRLDNVQKELSKVSAILEMISKKK